jgi:hypothetical protein
LLVNGHYPVWFNSAIIAKIRKKSNVFKKYKRTGLPSYFIEFKNLRRDVKREIGATFRNYISKVQEKLVCDPKNFWSFVNNKKGRNRIPSRMSNGGLSLSSFSEIVNSFAIHFKNSYDTVDAPANLIDVPCIMFRKLIFWIPLDCLSRAYVWVMMEFLLF